MNKLSSKLLMILAVFFIFSFSATACHQCGTFRVTNQNGDFRDIYSTTQPFYNVGDKVYVTTQKSYFPANNNTNAPCSWYINRNGQRIASGNITTDNNGNFSSYYVYTTTMDDVPTPTSGGKELILYIACKDCGTDYSTFRVQANEVPEFGTAAALVALIGSVGIFMVIRKRQ